ncbi:hypothetical protein POM88_013090 [Heracleum sosnowskyi]|uniref:Uncharacterized protein n=1 Tax=Heracleum sosnowskyi TaxID=360622 RepID=A0AAD8IZB5_9APIA|nr:hypothetical protein POM88_013090 [Heracleum sosnowskyi]
MASKLTLKGKGKSTISSTNNNKIISKGGKSGGGLSEIEIPKPLKEWPTWFLKKAKIFCILKFKFQEPSPPPNLERFLLENMKSVSVDGTLIEKQGIAWLYATKVKESSNKYCSFEGHLDRRGLRRYEAAASAQAGTMLELCISNKAL